MWEPVWLGTVKGMRIKREKQLLVATLLTGKNWSPEKRYSLNWKNPKKNLNRPPNKKSMPW
jgi:hypothetical protein